MCDGTDYAVLKQCPKGYYYFPKSQRCYPYEDKTQAKRTKRETLFDENAGSTRGNPQPINQKLVRSDVQLGWLYDAQTDQYLPGSSLWSKKVLDQVIKDHRTTLPHTSYDFSKAKTTIDRMKFFEVEAELRLSILGKLNEYYKEIKNGN